MWQRIRCLLGRHRPVVVEFYNHAYIECEFCSRIPRKVR